MRRHLCNSRQGVRQRSRSERWLAGSLLTLALVASWPLASAQGTPTQEPAAPTPAQLTTPTDTGPGAAGEAPTAENGDATADLPTPPTVTPLAVDSTGGPLTLPEDVEAAIAAWRQAVPDLVNLSVATVSGTLASQDGDRVVFADVGLMGPDTLSLGLRLQGTKGIEVRLAPQTYRAHPAVLLHELGVFLGLPEGGDDGVMAFRVPGTGELTAPSPADVAALRERLRFSPEDLTRDGVVDFDDLVAFGQAYGSLGLNVPADFDGDGAVGPSDLERLRAAYTYTLPADEGTASEETTEETQETNDTPPDEDDAPAEGPDATGGTSDETPLPGAAPDVVPEAPPDAPPGTPPPDPDVPPPSAPSGNG